MNTSHTESAYKGVWGGECARTACLNLPAVYFNISTRWYYCENCAQRINAANGVKLCSYKAPQSDEDVSK